jgi:NADH-quinone oxidoreductase subunit E
MSARRPAPDSLQPATFAFDRDNQDFVAAQVAKYPAGRQASAVIPLLWQAQKQAGGWLPRAAIEHVAQVLDMPNIRVMEVATFYTMFNLEPVGQHFIQLCGTVPCHCMGAEDLKKVLKARIGDERHVTADGKFSWLEVECLGACTNAPMVQINDEYYEDLTVESFSKMLDDLAAGKPVKVGPQNGRLTSEPKGGPKTLLDASLYDGSSVGGWQKAFDARVAAAKKAKEDAAIAAEIAKAAEAGKAAEAAAPAVAAVAAAPAVAAPSRPAKAVTNATQDTPAAGGQAATAKGSAGAAAKGAAAKAAPTKSDAPAKAVSPKAAPAKAAPAKPAAKPDAAAMAAEEAEIAAKLATLPKSASAEQKADAVGTRPKGLKAARGATSDDLKRIKGIGKVNEGKLNALGIFHFDQIAAWSRAEIRWVGTYLAFPGRIDREDWLAQAGVLAAGGETEFSTRVDKGDVPSSKG